MDAQTTVTVRCTACGKLGEVRPSCGCGANFEYVSPGELAAEAIKAHPEKSDRAIADKLGIGANTVKRARDTTAPNGAVGKRVGKDGKTRRMPRKKSEPEKPKERVGRRGQSMPQLDRAREIVRPLMDAGKPFQCHDLEREHSISHYTFDSAICAEKARIETLTEIAAGADFSKITAQQKRDAALRVYAKELDRQFEQRVQVEYTARVKKNFPDLDKMQRTAAEEKRTYERLNRERQHIMSVADFTFVLSCLHPDSRMSTSEGKLKRAFQMLEPKKFAITGEK